MKKQIKKERYEKLSAACEPFRKAKAETIHTLAGIGRKHRLLRYPILIMLVAYIFIFNVILYGCIQLKIREKFARGVALVMTLALVFTSIDFTVFAVTRNGDSVAESKSVITAFAELDDSVAAQSLPIGAEESKISFPAALTVTLETKPEADIEQEDGDAAPEEGLEEPKNDTTEPEEGIEPEESVTPETNTLPEESATPETNTLPEESATPETGTLPEESATPETGTLPEESATPETSTLPEESATPETSTLPEESTSGDMSTDVPMDSVAPAVPESSDDNSNDKSDDSPDDTNIVSAVTDLLLPEPMVVYAAELNENTSAKSEVLIDVTWKLDADASTSATFDSSEAGNSYVYVPIISEKYTVAEGVSLPEITVTVVENTKATDGGEIALLMRALDEENSSDMVYYLEGSFDSYLWEIWTGEEWQEIGQYEPELVVGKEEWCTYRFRCVARRDNVTYTAHAKDDWQTENMGVMLMAETAADSTQTGEFMYYNNKSDSSGSGSRFNIKGMDKGTEIKTTYSDSGYRTASTVNGGSKVSWNSDSEVPMGDSLYGSRKISLVYSGRYAKIEYTVENKGSESQSFQVGSSADVMIGNNDCAPVKGSSNGLVMEGSPKNDYTFNLVVPSANTLWYGYYSQAYANIFTDLADKSTAYNKDSGMAWSWQDTVAPGQTWSRYVLLGVGDLPTPPKTPELTNTNLKLEPGVSTTFTGTADPGNTVNIEVYGEEFTSTADSSGNFKVNVTPSKYLPEGTTNVKYYAVSKDGGISDVGTITVPVTKKPEITLTDVETTVAEDDRTLNDNWYRSFIRSSSGTVSYNMSSVKIGTPGTYTVNYKASKSGYSDATATLKIKVLPLPLELSEVTPTRVSGKNSYTLSASLKHIGEETITETGFVWGVMQNPTVSLNNGSKKTTSAVATKNGKISLTAGDIVDGVTYYVRAYAKSGGNVYYSPQNNFSIGGKNYGEFTITNNGNNTFTVTRRDGSDGAQTIYYRTVNGSAVGGTHFEHKAGTLTFGQGDNTSKTITITEKSVTNTYGGKPATAYSNADRTYQVEIYRVDGGGTLGGTTRATRTMTKNSSYTVDRNCYKTKKERVYDGELTSKSDSLSPDSTSYTTVFIMNRYHTEYLDYLKETAHKYEMHMNIWVYEYEDGWEFLRFKSGNETAVAKFEINPDGNYRDWVNGWIPGKKGTFENGVIKSYDFPSMEAYESTVVDNTYVFGFDINEKQIEVAMAATGEGPNDWQMKECEQESWYSDIKEPQLIGIAPMDTSTYRVGDKITISLVFDEIVDSTNSNNLAIDNSYITTNWGTFYYAGGKGTNVLYFAGTVPANASGSISVTNLNCKNQIKDMCNNSGGTASGGINGKSTSVTVNTNVPTVSFADKSTANQTAKATIKATNATKLQYTWTQSSTLPVKGWISAANTSSQTVGNRLTPGTWYLHVLATYSDTGKTTHSYKEFTITDNGAGTTQGGEVVPPDLMLSVDNSSWARQRTIAVTKTPSNGKVTVKKMPSGTTSAVTGDSYTATENGSYQFTLTAGDEKVVKTVTVSKIDRTAPSVTITGPASTTQNENVKLTIKPVDTGGSGVNTVTATWKKTVNGGTEVTENATLTKNSDGTYSVTTPGNAGNKYTYRLMVTVMDNAKNSSVTAVSKTYTINLKIPAVTVNKTSSNPKKGDTYSYTVNTNENTITSVQLPDGTITTDLDGTFTLTSRGTYYVTVSDAAGHVVRSSAMTVTADVDGVNPEVRLSQRDEKWTNGAVRLDVSIYEEGGVQSAVWKKDGVSSNNTLTYSREETSVYSGSFSVTKNGTYKVTVTDTAGNIGTDSITVKNIDKTPPTVTCKVGIPNNSGWYTADKVPVTLNFNDIAGKEEGGKPSGIKSVEYKLVPNKENMSAAGLTSLDESALQSDSYTYEITGNGTYYFYYKVTDKTGNVTDGFSGEIKKDSCVESAVIEGTGKGQPKTDGLNMSIKLTHGPSGGTLYAGMDGKSQEAELATVSGYNGMDVVNTTITKNYNNVTNAGRHYFRYYDNASGTSNYWYFYVYDITFDSQRGNGVKPQLVWMTQESGSVDTAVQCAVVKPSAPTRTGYTFGGWYTNAACTGSTFDFEKTQVRENTTLYAKWTAVSYGITYDLNGGALETGVSNPSKYTIESNDITLNNPTRTGYTFKGWSGTDLTDDANTEVIIAKGSTGTRSYTANWTPNEYTVSFDYQNATGGDNTENTTVTYDSAYGPLPTPERTGYTFAGWYTAAGATGTKVETTTTVTTPDDHTLFAGWTPNKYMVTFEYQNATGGNDTKETIVTYDSTYGILPNPTRTGYTFVGWYTAAGATGTKVETTTTVTTSDNHMLYAGWATVTYDITYDLNGGALAEDVTNPSEYTIESDDITLNNPIRTGYDFKGWSGTDLTGDANMSVIIAKGSTEDRSYTANWTPKTYTVAFDYQNATGGNDTENMTVTYDSAYGSLPVPERTGYNFKGWYTEESEGIEVTGTTIVKTAGDHTVYARWKDETAPDALVLPSDILLPTEWTRTQKTIPLVLHDDAGVNELLVSIDGGEYEKVEDFEGGTEYNYVVKEGEHTYRFMAKDAAGNTSEASEEFMIKLDTASPEMTVLVDRKPTDEAKQPNGAELSGSYYNSAPAITVTIKDSKADASTESIDTAGITSISYYIGGKEYPVAIDAIALRGQAVFTIPANVIPEGETTITIKAKDSAGNEMTENIMVRVKIPEENEDESDYEAETPTGDGKLQADGNKLLDGLLLTDSDQLADNIQPTNSNRQGGKNRENGTETANKEDPDGTQSQEQNAEERSDTQNEQLPEEESIQIVSASTEDGRITVTGDLVTTGNITEATKNATQLAVGNGAVIVTVVCEEENCTAGVSDTVAVANAVLAPEQIQLVNEGQTIEIRVDVKDISETVHGQDKEVIESGFTESRKEIPDLTLGMYVDISMFIKVGGGDWDAITSTEEPIDVVVGIPEELKEDGREFYIIRSHDGEYTLLTDMDDAPDTITVSTDRFSAYAIAYNEADKTEVQTPEESSTKCGLCHICPTFLGICCFIWLAIILAIVLTIWMVILWKRKQEKQ